MKIYFPWLLGTTQCFFGWAISMSLSLLLFVERQRAIGTWLPGKITLKTRMAGSKRGPTNPRAHD